jgi:hypothetical protein
MESVTFNTHQNGVADANGNGAGIDAGIDDGIDSVDDGIDGIDNGIDSVDDSVELHDLWRVWVTPSDRKRCTYVTRDEQPLAAVSADL